MIDSLSLKFQNNRKVVPAYLKSNKDNRYKVDYASALPLLPILNLKRKYDTVRLKEMRRVLEVNPSPEIIDFTFYETKDVWVDLCSDYIGNIIFQKLVEYGTEQQRDSLITAVAPYMAAIGIHKNGTWAIQKLIEFATTVFQIATISTALRPFTHLLLLDALGNYVVQACLRFPSKYNQFVPDTIANKCHEIGVGRFGARAIRTCLDSNLMSQAQITQVAEAITDRAARLVTNSNGSLLLNWVLDLQVSELYLKMALSLKDYIVPLCTHKIASLVVLRLVNQPINSKTREIVLLQLLARDHYDSTLLQLLEDSVGGYPFLQSLVTSPYLPLFAKQQVQAAIHTFHHRPQSQPTPAYDTEPKSNFIQQRFDPFASDHKVEKPNHTVAAFNDYNYDSQHSLLRSKPSIPTLTYDKKSTLTSKHNDIDLLDFSKLSISSNTDYKVNFGLGRI